MSNIKYGNPANGVNTAEYIMDRINQGRRDKLNFDIHKFIDECMVKKDRYVSIFIGDHGVSVDVYPLVEDEEKTEQDNKNQEFKEELNKALEMIQDLKQW